MMVGVVVLCSLVAGVELLSFYQVYTKKEMIFYAALMGLVMVLSAIQTSDIQIPSPANGIEQVLEMIIDV